MKPVIRGILIFTTIYFSGPLYAGSTFSPKLGYVDWGTRIVRVNGNDLQFHRAESDWFQYGRQTIGFEYSYLFNFNLAVGGEASYARLEFDNATGYAHATQYIATVKYFLPSLSLFSPYAGVGTGMATFNVHSTNSAKLTGYMQMGRIGIELKPARKFALGVEYRETYLDLDDKTNNKLSSHNRELFFQITMSTSPKYF